MNLPLDKKDALKAAAWMQRNFGDKLRAAANGTPFSSNLLISIALQETAQRWLLWINDYDVKTVLARCVFDASGDFPDTHRGAFPRNQLELRRAYGDDITDMLIAEANLMRAMPQPGDHDGYGPARYLYKGYGIFQYDLQNIVKDKVFFEHKLWYQFDNCLSRLMIELRDKFHITQNKWDAVRAYNGSGPRAENYRDNVKQFNLWLAEAA
jgi:hypothetical protein